MLNLDALENEAFHLFIVFQGPKYQVGGFFIRGRECRSAWSEWETQQAHFPTAWPSQRMEDAITRWRMPPSQSVEELVNWSLVSGTHHSSYGILHGECHVARRVCNFPFFSLFCIWIASFLRTWLQYGQIPEMQTKYPHNTGNRGKTIIKHVQNESK